MSSIHSETYERTQGGLRQNLTVGTRHDNKYANC